MSSEIQTGNEAPLEKRRHWIAGIIITATTIVSYFAFWHISPIATFLIGLVALVALVIAGWVLGGD